VEYQSNLGPTSKALEGALLDGMGKAMRFCERYAKALVSRGNAPRKRLGEGEFRAGMVGLSPSAPGEAPKRLSGLLGASIATRVERRGNQIVGTLGTTTAVDKYAPALEFGSAGGEIITPRRTKLLRFMTTDGVTHYEKSVVRGRIAPRPFLRPTILKNRAKITQIVSTGSAKGLGETVAAIRGTK